MRKRQTQPGGGTLLADPRDPAEGDRQFVTALHRGLQILRCFRPNDNGLGNLEIAKRSGLPNSTVSRLTYTLSKLGYLLYDEQTGRYRMGVAVLGLGYACVAGMHIRETAQHYMQNMADKYGDGLMVALGGRDQLTMTYIACARSEGIITLQLNVGSRISLARSAMGRAYIAGAGEKERTCLLQAIRESVGEAQWPRIEDGILEAIEQVRTQGFYANIGGWHGDINAVAVPSRSASSETPLLAFNCGGPAYLWAKDKLMNEIGPDLVRLVNTVNDLTGQR
jgi:DNA-binding IclR family transcriptional regulator